MVTMSEAAATAKMEKPESDSYLLVARNLIQKARKEVHRDEIKARDLRQAIWAIEKVLADLSPEATPEWLAGQAARD